MKRKITQVRAYDHLGSIYLTPKTYTRDEAANFIADYQERLIDSDDLQLLSLTDKFRNSEGEPVTLAQMIEDAEFDLEDLPLNLL